jgi:hypothetical protein
VGVKNSIDELVDRLRGLGIQKGAKYSDYKDLPELKELRSLGDGDKERVFNEFIG